ncbi:hypothetical protein VI08_01840 [Luteibacter yeojuensis]|uniref:Uncharacterized protein n=1 Tax=Luteibacter yeojuensis TaxID=345309 RepID=A0A0F3L0N0_9GAMM|nr:hypothetical protein VI08_01840 [Luteibacter yeojuensis]
MTAAPLTALFWLLALSAVVSWFVLSRTYLLLMREHEAVRSRFGRRPGPMTSGISALLMPAISGTMRTLQRRVWTWAGLTATFAIGAASVVHFS